VVNQEASDAKAVPSQAGRTHDRRPHLRSRENLAELTFSNQQLADLQKGAMNRAVTAKASISAATAGDGRGLPIPGQLSSPT
jgi:hypothetical protein